MVLTSGRDVRIDGTNSETSTADLKLETLNPFRLCLPLRFRWCTMGGVIFLSVRRDVCIDGTKSETSTADPKP